MTQLEEKLDKCTKVSSATDVSCLVQKIRDRFPSCEGCVSTIAVLPRLLFKVQCLCAAQAKAVTEASLKNCRDNLSGEKKTHKSLQKALDEDQALLTTKQGEVGRGLGSYQELQARVKAAEEAVLAAQQHFQAVTAGLSSGAGGQEETLAAQKIGVSGVSQLKSGSAQVVWRPKHPCL